MMDSDYYKDVSCLVTGSTCDVNCDCDDCEIGQKSYKEEREKIEQDRITDITTFKPNRKFYGVQIVTNVLNTIVKTDRNTLDELKKNGASDVLSSTPCEYDLSIELLFPDFSILKHVLKMDKPVETLYDIDIIAVFIYDDCIYLCSPMVDERCD